MAGYGGQLVALDVNTPSESELAAAQASTANAQSELAQQTVPYEVELRRQQAAAAGLANTAQSMTNQSSALTLQQQIQFNAAKQHLLAKVQAAQATGGAGSPAASPLASTAGASSLPAPAADSAPPLFDPRIQQAMQSIDPKDPDAAQKWDDAMVSMVDEVPQAQQFIGQYSAQNVNNWRSMIGSHEMRSALQSPQQSPLAAGGAGPLADASSPLAPGTSAAPAATAPVSPVTGQPDPDLAAMSIIDPKGTGEFLKLQGMMRYQQTGDINDLKRYAPDVYKDLAAAQKDLTGAQKEAVTTRASIMGQSANAVLALAAKLGKDAPEVRAAYNTAVVDAAKQGWIPPQLAQQELNNPIDFGRLSYLAVSSQTVSEFMKTSGQEAANEAAAEHHLERVERTDPITGQVTVRFVPLDANGNVIQPTGGASGAASVGSVGVGDMSAVPFAQVKQTIISHEAPAAVGGYNAQAYNTAGGGNSAGLKPVNLTGMTMGQVADYQKNVMRPATAGQRGASDVGSTGVGAYQFENGTLQQNAAQTFGANWRNVPFTPANQDRVAETLFNTVRGDPNALGKTWAAFQNTSGGTGDGTGDGGPGTTFVTNPGTAATGIDPTLSGPEAMAALQKANLPLANRVQGILDGRIPYPSNSSARAPGVQVLLNAVSQVDPSFDATKWQTRKNTATAYAPGGNVGTQITSGKIAVNHLYDMLQTAQSLPDHNTKVQNSLSNWLSTQTNNPDLIKYNHAVGIYAPEVSKFLTGKSPAQAEIEHTLDGYSPNLGRTGILTAGAQDAKQLVEKFEPILSNYQDVMGKPLNVDGQQFPGGPATAKLAALRYWSDHQSDPLPVVVSTPQDATRVHPGTVFVTPDGRLIKRQ